MNNLEHSLNINTNTNFIKSAIQYCCKSKKCTILDDLLEYVFYDIVKEKRDELYDLLMAAAIQQKNDIDTFFIIYNCVYLMKLIL